MPRTGVLLPCRRVALVNAAGRGGATLERALEARGWSPTRVSFTRDVSPFAIWRSFDAVVVILADHDIDVLEMLLRLSAAPGRPPILLLTRRARTATYSTHALRVLGVDRLVTWPSSTEAIVDAVDRTWAEEVGALAAG